MTRHRELKRQQRERQKTQTPSATRGQLRGIAVPVRAEDAFDEGNYRLALEEAKKALHAKPHSIDALIIVYRSYFALGHRLEAIPYLKQLQDIDRADGQGAARLTVDLEPEKRSEP
jgi:tetratricopeptide (TPR) repeat protein